MFNSIHSQKILKWLSSPKKYLVNTEVILCGEVKNVFGSRYTFISVEVIARNKHEAKQKAKNKVRKNIEVKIKGLKSLGRVKSLNEF